MAMLLPAGRLAKRTRSEWAARYNVDAAEVPWCLRCDNAKPARVHHCSRCGECVLRLDHHCVFVNNCIGAHNIRHFIRFLITILVSTLYLAVYVATELSARFIDSTDEWALLNQLLLPGAGGITEVSQIWIVLSNLPGVLFACAVGSADCGKDLSLMCLGAAAAGVCLGVTILCVVCFWHAWTGETTRESHNRCNG